MDRQEYPSRHWDRDPWDAPSPPRRKRRGAPLIFGAFLALLTISVGAFWVVSQHQTQRHFLQPDYGWALPGPSGVPESAEPSDPEEPERAPVGTGVTMEVRSSQGKPELTYQELYSQCAGGVVSVRAESRQGSSLGTGIIMTQDGYIITNCHVVDDCHTVTAVLEDARELNALLVGKDEETDLAVLKVEAQGLTSLEFGDSTELMVGDAALAIGNPLGEHLRGTLTNGIISAINRDISMNGYSMTLIQTTAALNQGNSGGPLLNIYGQVVGVNNMKIMSSYSTVEGLGFAIPTSVAKAIVDELIQAGYISRAVIGITCYAVDETFLEREDFQGGLCVVEVNPGSGAYDAGLEPDDIIVEANGIPIRSMDDMAAVKEGLGIGDVIDMVVFRGEEETLELSVPLCDQRDLK